MRFVAVRDFRTSSASIWRDLPAEQEMIITNNGKPIALLTPLNDATLENTVAAVRRAKALDAVNVMQRHSVKLGNDKMPLKMLNRLIRAARQR
ncbi:MAG: type II toxin-antitoxin system Phd/YefM family antitoxin [Candidatus Margulisbacteria bacterium]|nr:type II toxin-antitoxin system Phd/YefM family antitoxin [Candidatus Margulisiibacteriota bacterium]